MDEQEHQLLNRTKYKYLVLYIWFYGRESCTAVREKRILAYKRNCYCRILKISWMQHKTKKGVTFLASHFYQLCRDDNLNGFARWNNTIFKEHLRCNKKRQETKSMDWWHEKAGLALICPHCSQKMRMMLDRYQRTSATASLVYPNNLAGHEIELTYIYIGMITLISVR